MMERKKVGKLLLIIGVLLSLVIVNSACIAAVKKEIIEDAIHVNIAFCKEPGINGEIIYKNGANNPILLKVGKGSNTYSKKEILRGEIISRDYTISPTGLIAYVSSDSIHLALAETGKEKIESRLSEEPSWSPRGDKFVYCYQGKLISYDIANKSKHILSEGKKIRRPLWISEDQIIFVKDDNITILNLTNNEEKYITTEKASYPRLIYDSQKHVVYFVRRLKGSYGILQYKLKTKELSTVINGNFQLLGLGPKGDSIYLIDIDNKRQLFSYDLKTKAKTIIEDKNAVDGISTYDGSALLYSTFDKLYLY